MGRENPIAASTVDPAAKSEQVKRVIKVDTSASFSTIIYRQQARQTGNNSLPIFTGVKRLHVRPAIKERRQLKKWCWQDMNCLHWLIKQAKSATA